jgi:hypothetical protein
VICGVASLAQFEDLMQEVPATATPFDWPSCALQDAAWLDPSRWQTGGALAEPVR